ncbi:two-component system response regulator CseB [Streptomyces sp. NRRL B-24484]|uniref:two-component system response regulator CseB n=1 Tax=Streptomyces sp. NRRL B-24484 TaxID=1463833 RepID=UPI0004C0D36C|nr:two-component system response regulator CseB [Streptomyces sp. NRRL B-24484]
MTAPLPPLPAGPPMPRILIVEDDEVIREATQMALERYGFPVDTAADGLQGLERFRARRPDLLLIDVMLPLLDGVGLCRRVREESNLPILMMSARGEAVDVVSGLEAGADDYVVKPFEIAVLVARIRTVLRRTGPVAAPASAAPSGTAGAWAAEAPQPVPSALRVIDDLAVDTDAMEVTVAGEPVPLTPTELRLLLEFTAAPGVVMERQTLLSRVWDYSWDADSRVVDVHVQRLRAKIGAGRIETVRGFGYRLRRIR